MYNAAVDLSGILPPIATPFRGDDEAIDLEAVAFNVDRWMRTGLRGLVVLGTNGEAPYVEPDEAARFVAAVRERVPRDRVLVAGAGHDSTRATIEACRRAARAGADAVLVRTPAAFKSQMTATALVAHFRAVADGSPVPVILYSFAANFGVTLPLAAVVTLAGHPNVAGLKESGGDLSQIADQVSATPDDFPVVVGSAATLYASLCVGASGGVVAVANVAPEACVRLFELTRAGRHDEALALQRALSPLARAVTTEHGVAGLKAAMELAGYRGGVPRRPLAPAPDTVIEIVRRRLAALHDFLGAAHAVTARH
jgi:4-hydroxy-2-oxoglutarate aldolase